MRSVYPELRSERSGSRRLNSRSRTSCNRSSRAREHARAAVLPSNLPTTDYPPAIVRTTRSPASQGFPYIDIHPFPDDKGTTSGVSEDYPRAIERRRENLIMAGNISGDYIVEYAAHGVLRALEARGLAKTQVQQNGFVVEVFLRTGGIGFRETALRPNY